MLPRWHILYGAIFSLIIWLAVPNLNPLYIVLTFLASVFIDFDHYMCSVCKTKKISLFHSFRYHEKLQKREFEDRAQGIRAKSDFHIFHTIEFHILIGILSFFWIGFFYIFIGMVFHSLLDIISLLYDDFMYVREFFLVRWLWRH